MSSDGKKYLTDCFNTADTLRLIQSIPSNKRTPIRNPLLNMCRSLQHNGAQAVCGDVDGDGSLAGGDGYVFGLAFFLGDEEDD